MANALDYIAWRGDLGFDDSPVNEVDLFICSQICSVDFDGIVPECGEAVPLFDAADRYFEIHGLSDDNLGPLQSSSVLPMLDKLRSCPRFKFFKLKYFINRVNPDNEEQFCALTLEIPDGSTCVVFRGTDDSIIGWKEDFNFATKAYVPSQHDALEYLKFVASSSSVPIYVCGHSKGGNLAIYASSLVSDDIKNRIVSVYSFDGPGFNDVFINSSAYGNISSRITTVLSQNSLVGTLLSSVGNLSYVTSCKSGPLAHDGFTWEVLGPEFLHGEGLSKTSKSFKYAISETLLDMNDTEKQKFVDELFDTLLSTGATTITELCKISPSKILDLAKTFHEDKRVQKFTLDVLEMFFKGINEPIVSGVSKIHGKRQT